MTSFALIDDRYMVDSCGDVYGPRAGKLKKFKAVRGQYEQVRIDGKNCYVHRLVAVAFIPNPLGKTDVAHCDGNGLNNKVVNLRWATKSENMSDKKIHGTHLQGERDPKAKLTDLDVWEIRQHKARGAPVDVLAREYGVSRWTIYDACNPNRRKLADY